MGKYLVLLAGILLAPSLNAQDEAVDRGLYVGLGLGVSSVTKKGGAENVPDHFIGINKALTLGYKYENPYSLELIVNNISSLGDKPNGVSEISANFTMLAIKSHFYMAESEMFARFGVGQANYRIDYSQGYRVGHVTDLSHDWSGVSYLVGGGWNNMLNKKWMFGINIDYMGGNLNNRSSTSSGDLDIETFNITANLTFKNFMPPEAGAKILAGGAGAIIGALAAYSLVTHIAPSDNLGGSLGQFMFSFFVGGGAGILTGIHLASDSEEHKVAIQFPF